MEKTDAKRRWLAQCAFEKQWTLGCLILGILFTLPIGVSRYTTLSLSQTYFLLALAGIGLFRTLQGGYLSFKVRNFQQLNAIHFEENYTHFLENEQLFYKVLVHRLEQQINLETLGFILGMLLLFAGLLGPLANEAIGIGSAILLQTAIGIIYLAIRKWKASIYMNEMGF